MRAQHPNLSGERQKNIVYERFEIDMFSVRRSVHLSRNDKDSTHEIVCGAHNTLE